MGEIIIIGGGIVGLSCAYYLRKTGHSVSVLDKDDFTDNCSYGNAGYICPCEYVPLACPESLRSATKWIWNSRSPFFVQPRLSRDLISWGFTFLRNSNHKSVARAAIPKRDISALSQSEYRKWQQLPEFNFPFYDVGRLKIFRTEESLQWAQKTARDAEDLGLKMKVLTRDELVQIEPEVTINATGAIHYISDSHVYPNALMRSLRAVLVKLGVKLLSHQKVIKIERKQNTISRIITERGTFMPDQVVLAAGTWSRELAEMINISLPMVSGRGYSVTTDSGNLKLRHPVSLLERSVAITPLTDTKIRFGGTMEVVPMNTPPRYKRVEGIIDAVNEYFPQVQIQMPRQEDIWFGYRPLSGDGMPYIGYAKKYENLLIATGHSMLGISMGSGTGKLISELINGKEPSIDIGVFDANRFS